MSCQSTVTTPTTAESTTDYTATTHRQIHDN